MGSLIAWALWAPWVPGALGSSRVPNGIYRSNPNPGFTSTWCKSLLLLLKFVFGPAQPRCCIVNVFDVVNKMVPIVVSYVGNVTEYGVSYFEYSLSHKCIPSASMSRDVLFLP